MTKYREAPGWPTRRKKEIARRRNRKARIHADEEAGHNSENAQIVAAVQKLMSKRHGRRDTTTAGDAPHAEIAYCGARQ
ncbi:hypothetical protein [Demequina rhizosphaerae]|uniref:hypothetical protein n=1 Tax=Demequina rhizosphaerae TaxID=1638985 RepID=UPI000784200A|nr:hypothetical protein [Demequina rhizosphaerae]